MLFAFFGLWTTALLAGAAAVSVPVIIHLLNRRRYKIVTWAAMRFLLNAQRQNTRKMRVEQLLLLVTRMAMVAAIVVAMAAVMPWAEPLWAYIVPANWIQLAQHREERVHHIFVLDASMSMNLHDGNKTIFDRAAALALAQIENSQPSDGFSVLLLKDSPTWLIGEASQDRPRVRRELEAVRCGHGNASLPIALNMVAAKLIEAGQRFPAQFVYFITDRQRSSWQSAASASEQGDDARDKTLREIRDRAGVAFVDVGRDDVTNLAVTDLSFTDPFVTTGNAVQVNATVKNFGVEPKQVHVELLVGKARENSHEPPLAMHLADEKAMEEPLRPNDQRVIKLTHRFPNAGTYAVQVRLQSADPLDVDDARAVVVTVKDTIPVLVVNGKLAPDRFETATGYLRLVLNPYPPGSERKDAPLRPRVVTQRQFADMTEDDLKEYDCVYWCDVGQFGSADLRRMETHVRLGGGIVFSMGDRAAENLDAYNRLLYRDEHGLLPAKLLKKVTAAPEQHFYLKAADEDKSFLELPLREFKDERFKTTLNHVRFYQYVQTAPAPQARQILKYQPEEAVAGAKDVKGGEPMPIGDPAMLEWNPPMSRGAGDVVLPGKDGKRTATAAHYRGKVVLVTSTVNTDWTNWPGSPSYVAMMQELTRLAASGRLREQAGVVGSVLEEYLPGGGAELDVTMHYPESFSDLKPVKSRTHLLEDVNVFHFADTDYSGIYRVVVNVSGQEIPFAINVPVASVDQHGSESDLARLSEEALRKNFPDWKIQIVTDPRSVNLREGPAPVTVTVEPTPVGPAIARYLLIAVFALLFVEVIMAWRFGHYTTVEGVTAPATASVAWPLALAITALVVFLIGAYFMYRIVQADDVLAVIPEWLLREKMRGWFEWLLGVAPPPPGESSRWKPNFDGWVPDTLMGIGGSQHWWAIGLFLFGGTMVLLTYLAEAPAVAKPYKLILAGLRLCMLAMTIWLLLPQAGITFTYDVYPDLVILLDTSRSFGEPDSFQDTAVMNRSKQLSDLIRKHVEVSLPEKVKQLRTDLEAATKKKQADPADTLARDEVDYLEGKIRYWEKQQEIINSPKWRPTRLQLAQALFAQPDNDWLSRLHLNRKMKVHVYQLDVNGRAVKLTDAKGPAGEIVDPQLPSQIERTKEAIARLEADGKESRLGTALKQVIDQYRGSSLAGVIMITDGVTTRDRTIAESGGESSVPLFLIGIGDDHEIRDLKLHDLQCDDTVFKGDRVNFECRLTGQGYTDLTVPIVLKVKGKDGKEKKLKEQKVKVDPRGKSVKVRFQDTPNEVGRKTYIIEVEQPKIEGNEKPMPPGNLRLERAIEVVEDKEIRVLYVEQQPRYEFRYVKFLLERETPNQKNKKKSITLNVVLLDAEDGFAEQDKTALSDFPPTLDELNKYDVVVFGDCDPNHRKLGMQRLKNLANFVRGEDEKGRKLPKAGGGFLMIAGTMFSPHAYRNTPLADILPIEPLADKPPREPDRARTERLRPELTPSGRVHPIFKFSNDDGENAQIWQRLAPMFWTSSHYRIKPLAEVLAVHPSQKAEGPLQPNQDSRLPLVVQQYVGTGRSMFVGFDETWRWRLRDDETKFNHYWVQVMRYLSRGRSNRTDLSLDRQTPYRLGEVIKVRVRFPDGATGPDGMRITDKTEVKVVVEYRPQADEKDVAKDVEYQTMSLNKVEGSWGTYEGALNRTREGKYRFRLTNPDVRKYQPDGESPSADALVELPPGELDRLRMNAEEMLKAADSTQGRFYTLATADRVVDEVPPARRISFSTSQPPLRVWNHAIVFCMVMLLLTSEWFLRKRKHLL